MTEPPAGRHELGQVPVRRVLGLDHRCASASASGDRYYAARFGVQLWRAYLSPDCVGEQEEPWISAFLSRRRDGV